VKQLPCGHYFHPGKLLGERGVSFWTRKGCMLGR
jgi:hypothetical protein